MSNKKKEALRVKMTKEDLGLPNSETNSSSESELDKTNYQMSLMQLSAPIKKIAG